MAKKNTKLNLKAKAKKTKEKKPTLSSLYAVCNKCEHSLEFCDFECHCFNCPTNDAIESIHMGMRGFA